MNKPICNQCEQENKKYTVQEPMGGMTTLLAWNPGYWDEQGNYHSNPNPNRTTYTYHCSNGHSWNETV